jgi:hypothetical protein
MEPDIKGIKNVEVRILSQWHLQLSYNLSISIVKSDELRVFPHVLHLPSWARIISLIGLKLIILEIIVPHLPQITSVEG